MKGEQFIKLPRDLLESDAWRGLSINARRLIDFIMLEHMRQGGKRNGLLLAPREQLEAFGIGRHFISGAIHEVARTGLVDVIRGPRPESKCLSLHLGSGKRRRANQSVAGSVSSGC